MVVFINAFAQLIISKTYEQSKYIFNKENIFLAMNNYIQGLIHFVLSLIQFFYFHIQYIFYFFYYLFLKNSLIRLIGNINK